MTKAEAYAKVREKIALRFGSNVAEEIFSEFEESDDERMWKLIKKYVHYNISDIALDADHITREQLESWLEKQDKQSNNEEAEKEKNDYVSSQFLYCKGSFNEFKEGESYWLEYVGNDNYIGRSDNILNQKFHITPRQLYTWLDPTCGYMHCENDTDENSAPRECGKSEDEVIRNCIGMCLTDASERRFKDYNTSLKECLDWLEKQGNSNSQNWKPSKEQINALEHFVRSIAESGYASPYDDNTKLLKSLINDLHKLEKQKDINALIQQAYKQGYTEGQRIEKKHWLEKQGESTLIEEIKRRKELYSREKEKAVLFAEKLSLGGRIAVLEELLVFANEKQGEQKPILDFKASNWYVSKVDGKIHDLTYNPTDKTQPKFKVGDWVVDNCGYVWKIEGILNKFYILECVKGGESRPTIEWVDKTFHLWSIQDAKDGDVLVDGNFVGLFKENNYNPSDESGCTYFYCSFDIDNKKFYTESGGYNPTYLYPAIKEQRDLLFQKMKETGWEFDFENKELKKINSYCQENCKGYQETGKCFADGGCDAKHKAEQESIAWTDDDEENLNGVVGVVERREMTAVSEQYKDILHAYTCWLKSLKDRVQPQSKTIWSDED